MRRGDDRPRESSKKKKRTGPICIACGYQWEKKAEDGEFAEYRLVRKKKGEEGGEEFVHKNEEVCRAHKLCCELGVELGANPPEAWLFARYPRDRMLVEADVRPKEWKRLGWLPRAPLERRILALVLYCSWCYPTCMAYAVQLAGICPRTGRVDNDDDQILADGRTGEIYCLRQKEIRLYLNESQQAVSRAMLRLVATKEIRVDEDDVIWPAAKLLEMSIAERQALHAQQILQVDPELRGVPKQCRSWMERIDDECPSDIRSVVFEAVKNDAVWSRKAFADLKSVVVERIKKSCSPALILIPDLFSNLRSSSPASTQTPQQPVPSMAGGQGKDDDESLNELYAGSGEDLAGRELREALYAIGYGKGTMAKLPTKKDQPLVLIHAHMQRWCGSHLLDMVIPTAIWQKAKAGGWSPLEVCVVIDQRGPKAGKQGRNPAKFLESCVMNLLIPSARDKIRADAAAESARIAAELERERERSAEQSVADALEAAFEARWTGLPDDERERRIESGMKRLAAEAKAAKVPGGGGKQSEWSKWQALKPEMRRARGETAAQRELRDEMDSEASAKGGE